MRAMTRPRQNILALHSAATAADVAAAPRATHAVQLSGADAPSKIQLLPLGTFSGRDGRGPYTVADAAAIIAHSKALAPDGQLPVDYGHEMELGDAGARAAGWITDITLEDDGIYGAVSWTAAAAKSISDREFRFISPAFAHDAAGNVLALISAALTNKPNLDLQSLNTHNSRAVRQSSTTQENHTMQKSLLERLRESFGLAADATEETVVAHSSALAAREAKVTPMFKAICTELKVEETAELSVITAAIAARSASTHAANAAPDPAKFAPMGVVLDLTERLAKATASSTANASEVAVHAAMAAGKLTPAQKEWALAYHAQDPKGFDAFIVKSPVILKPENGTTTETERLASTHAAQNGELKLDEDEVAMCAQMGLTQEDMLKTKKANLAAASSRHTTRK